MSTIDEMGRLTTDLLTQYLEGIARYDLLTAEDEVSLAQAMEAGQEARRRLEAEPDLPAEERVALQRKMREGRGARDEFIQANLRLVLSNARRYAGEDVGMLDLIQEGNLGLITAVEKFDWRKGFKFSTYATWWIRQAMQRARANLSDSIKIPAGVFDMLPTVRGAAESLRVELGRVATAEEIAEETGLSVGDVEKALAVSPTVALETPVGEDGAILGDFIADMDTSDPSDEVESRILGEALRNVLDQLPDLQRRALELRFGLGEDPPAMMRYITEALDIPEHRVRELISEAVEKLADLLRDVEEMRAA